MGKFLAGTAFGLILSVAYVWYGVALPQWLELPDTVQRSLKAAATDDALFDLDASADMRKRALEVYFDNQPKRAAALDADLGHPILKELTRRRAVRAARKLRGLWSAHDTALSKPALRKTLTTKHGDADNDTLKRRMLLDAIKQEPFLLAWLEKHVRKPTEGNIREIIREASHLDFKRHN